MRMQGILIWLAAAILGLGCMNDRDSVKSTDSDIVDGTLLSDANAIGEFKTPFNNWCTATVASFAMAIQVGLS